MTNHSLRSVFHSYAQVSCSSYTCQNSLLTPTQGISCTEGSLSMVVYMIQILACVFSSVSCYAFPWVYLSNRKSEHPLLRFPGNSPRERSGTPTTQPQSMTKQKVELVRAFRTAYQLFGVVLHSSLLSSQCLDQIGGTPRQQNIPNKNAASIVFPNMDSNNKVHSRDSNSCGAAPRHNGD